MTRSGNVSLWVAVAIVVLAIAVPTSYAEVEIGVSVFIPDTMESAEMADGSTTEKSTAKGFAVSSNAESPMHLMTQTCSGTWLVAPDEASRTGKGTCESIDPEGDVILFWWRGNQEGGTWGIESGTGKWEGAVGGGTWRAAAAWEDGRYANSWQGSWEAKAQTLHSPLDTGGE